MSSANNPIRGWNSRPPEPGHRRRGRIQRILLGAAALAACGIAVSEFVGLRSIQYGDAASLHEALNSPVHGGLAGRELSAALQSHWRADPEAADQTLARQLSRYPIDPHAWLLRASIARHGNQPQETLMAHLAAAVGSQAGSGTVQWQAAMIALATEHRDLAEHQLKLWLEDRPNMSGRALFIGARWIDSPAELIDRVLPKGEAYLIEAMRHARRQQDAPLARAVWERLEPPRNPESQVLEDYLTTIISAGDHAQVMNVWQQLDPYYRPGGIPAGHFNHTLAALPVFNWRTRMPAGVSLAREPAPDGPWLRIANPDTDAHALKLGFDGSENVNFRHLAVSFPVPEPGRYRLSGWWRADGLTTRSLPYLQASTRQTRWSATVEVPQASFAWQPFALDLGIGQELETFSLRVLRADTDAFDRYISGSLWLAALELKPLETVESLPIETADSRPLDAADHSSAELDS